MAEGVGKKIVYKKMQCRYNQNKKGQDTMKYSIAICDDARKDRELLRGFLGRWAGERGLPFQSMTGKKGRHSYKNTEA